MKIESIIGNSCTACDACVNVCPKNAISVVEDKYGFYQPSINNEICINCGACDRVCPTLNASNEKLSYKAYCGYSNKADVRRNSSSGGLFRSIADIVLSSGGVVFGAAFNYGNADLRLGHCSTDTVPIQSLQKSKYVQSYIGYTYRSVKKYLNEGKNVLFVGTPCQVAGLYGYLGKNDYDNLLTMDFICHGVPSMNFLRDHLRHIGFDKLEQITKIDFRPKITSWVDCLVVESSHKRYQRFYMHDAYFKAFNGSYISLRKSCFQCQYANGFNRKADITLADFWGVYKTDIKIDYKDGLSLVLAYTNRGNEIINGVNGKLVPIDIEDTDYIYRRDRSTYYPQIERNKFFEDYAQKGYEYAINNNGLNTPNRTVLAYNLKQVIKKLLK